MAQIGFLGLGIMGAPMARHLLQAGHEVALWSHQSQKALDLAGAGKGFTCSTPKQVAERADYIFYCVGDTSMAQAITQGRGGLLEGVRPGSIIADCSTIAPAISREIGAAFLAKDAYFLDAPCTGSRPGAEQATLTFMIGGDESAFERAKPYFELMGKTFYYCGGPGQGLQAKLTQNLVLANIMEAFAEGMVLATKGGIAPELMLEILNNSAAKSGLIAYKAPFIFARDFHTNFSAKWMAKDVGMALEQGKILNVPLPVTAVTEQMLRATISEGRGDDDFCSMIQVLEKWAGVVVKK
ncbi:MAG TPA: NAD(P)-dependent oxidoreductase [Terracidiphilus sp.]|jgi:3-hydroxyisobutyrate dehydrogenase/2-hydroxy-3-oxopropionate reductase